MEYSAKVSLVVHGIGYFWNLGLVRVSGSFSAERCSKTISDKLNEFGIDFETDIVGLTTDGCAMMKKVGKLIPALHQLCYAHGLQLVIHDIFHKKQTAIAEEQCDYLSETDESEREIDEMEDSDGLTVVTAFGDQQVDSLMLNHDIFWIAMKFVEL